VRSAPGKGTRFEIHLPVAATAAKPQSSELPAESPILGQGELLLLVDDEELVRTAVKRALVSRGYQVMEAGSAAEAVDLIEREGKRIRLLLTDVIMPGGRGTELARIFREKHADRPVLLMSGYVEPDEHPGASDLPVLEKPIAPAQLARAVRDALDGTPARPVEVA
jgi:two-component system cell cycle sensor histidine kinase/response regulator CckA